MHQRVPEPYKDIPGTFKIPGYPQLVVTKDGEFYSTLDNKKIKVQYGQNPDTYPQVGIPGKNRSRGAHVLVALAFINKHESDEPLEVNHKNGIKTDFSISNLEWVTKSENLLHAYRTGLRTQNQKIYVKNLMTDEVSEYFSIQECARQLDTVGSNILRYLRKMNTSTMFKGRYIFRLEGEEWPDYDPLMIGEFPRFVRFPVRVIFPDNTEKVYEDLACAAKWLALSKDALQMHFVRHKDRKDYYGLIFKPVKDYYELDKIDPDAIIKHPTKRKCPPTGQNKPIPIKVTNTKTGEVKVWDSSLDFSKYLGVTKSSLQGRVFYTGKYEDYQIEYVKE